jgi:hypothetical protein
MVGRALNDLGNATLGPVFTVVADDARLDAVFVQHCAHLIGRQIDVGFAVITLHKTVAVSVARNGALELCEEARRCAGTVLSCFNKSLF